MTERETAPAPRVLVVDDEEEVLRTLGGLIAQGDYEVVLLSQFVEARHYIDATPPEILVTDVRLGAYNGLQLVLHMRHANPGGRVIVLSAFDDPTIRQEAAALGAGFLCKPVTGRDLLAALANG
jgi:DNA-binding response OmpR family regulator